MEEQPLWNERLRHLLLSGGDGVGGSYAMTILHFMLKWDAQLICYLPLGLFYLGRMIVFEYNLDCKDIQHIIDALKLLADISPSLVALSKLDNDDDALSDYNYKLMELIVKNNRPQPKRTISEPVAGITILQQFLQYQSFCQQEEYQLSNLYKTFQNISSETELAIERARAQITSKTIIPYCNAQDKGCTGCRGKIHFVPLIQPHTDPLLGDCSYLDTCHKMEACKFVHYKTVYPATSDDDIVQRENPSSSLSGIWTGEYCLRNVPAPAQWINCDIRRLDLGILGQFSVIMADPAWNIHMNLPYGTCNDTEFIDLNIPVLQQEGIILLWVTGRAMEVGRLCLKTWGYKCIDEIIWVKTNQLQKTICTGRTGHWINHSKEHLLIGLKGNPPWLNKGIDVDVIVSPSRETSRKPDEVYDIVDRLVGKCASKLEIFGRQHNTRPGWLTLGNQLDATHIVDAQLLSRYNSWVTAQGAYPFFTN